MFKNLIIINRVNEQYSIDEVYFHKNIIEIEAHEVGTPYPITFWLDPNKLIDGAVMDDDCNYHHITSVIDGTAKLACTA